MKRALILSLLLILSGCAWDCPTPEFAPVPQEQPLQLLRIVWDTEGCAYAVQRSDGGGLRIVGKLPAAYRTSCRGVR